MNLKKHLFVIVILFNLCYPQSKAEIIAFCDEVSDFYGMPREILPAIIAVESSFIQNSISSKGAFGLMQVMSPAFECYQRLLKNPKVKSYDDVKNNWKDNIRVGSWYLFVFLRQYKGLGYKDMITAYFYGADHADPKEWYYERVQKNVSKTN